ncbi:MAG: hypothetical protein MI866_23360 [Bacteroidales bacterium]|nr:hypothetical protein [Bacteroidales bacterium]
MNKIRIPFIFISLYLLSACSNLPSVSYELGNARVKTRGNQLVVSTGRVERTWQLTQNGLSTVDFKSAGAASVSDLEKANAGADWAYYGLIDETSNAKLVSLTARQSDDEGFTSEHIEIVAEFEYPEVESFIKYVIWAYPDAPGIRTQVFIKGKASQYINNPSLKVKDDLQFDIVSGKNKNNYGAGAHAERYITTTLDDKKSIQVHAKGLDKEKQYKLGFTWWDFEGQGIRQNVRVSSVDGETAFMLLEDACLPDFSNKQEAFETILLDLPSETLLDGSCRIYFEGHKGSMARVSELFIFEEGNKKIEITNGLPERIDEIRLDGPEGHTLVGYLDCGEAIQGEKMIASGRVDFLPVQADKYKRRYVGYYNDTQHRNKPETPILKEVYKTDNLSDPEAVNWANLVCLSNNNSGYIMVKESHKCANQYGVETGEFITNMNGIQNTGTSLFPSEISVDEYKWCWASWSIAYTGGNDAGELALKQFDRKRYPVDPARDIYIQANTWGSGRNREASREENVLLELETQKELGIDIQQIDDGWQTKQWTLREDWYPEGWKNVVEKSEDTGVRIGLWAAAMPVTYEALKQHYDSAGFETYKLDFASLGNHKNMEKLIGKIRKFIKYTDHKVRVNWDLTENAPRFGYYWAREYGCIYLENRKPDAPVNVVYIPHLVLRDIWHVAKYTNINKFQTSIQNIEMTNREVSDAYLHNHPYSVAVGLVGTPLFFQETHNYSQDARDQIKPLLKTYKAHRDEMYNSFVFPIGNEPDNKSWTGFQWVNPDKNTGYLMLFRELHNKNAEQKIALRFMNSSNLKLTDIETGKSSVQQVNENGEINFHIDEAAGYRFYRYEF